ncbi:MAG: hypothetical protein ACTHLE_26895 [Agriterribacter sp.]
MQIPTYIINLKSRDKRKSHIEKEFFGRDEFSVSVIEAFEHTIGAIGLWRSLKKAIQHAADNNLDYFLLCEDDHRFTKNYNVELLKQCVEEAINRDANLLCGGVSWFEDAFPISRNLFWTRKFSGLQFTIIFKKLYAKVLSSSFAEYDSADYKLSELTHNKYFIHPFISTQKEFGYSDVTSLNNGTKRIEELFAITERNATALSKISSFYRNNQNNISNHDTQIDFENLTIPTYIINLPERADRRKHIIDQFNGRNEFDITLVSACKHEIGAVGLWQSIRRIATMAIDNDDDVIVICEDDHLFTPLYRKEFLLQNIIQAHEQGCDLLTCGTGKFDFAIPVSPNRFWVNQCLSTQFIVLYRKLIHRILEECYDDTVAADLKFSEMTRHKMILYPFISLQHDFGYSDVTAIHNEQKKIVSKMFRTSMSRLDAIAKAYVSIKHS